MNPARPDPTPGPPARGVDGKPAGPFAIEDCPLGAAARPEMERPALAAPAQASTSTLPEANADPGLTLNGAHGCGVFELDALDERTKARAGRGTSAAQTVAPIRLVD